MQTAALAIAALLTLAPLLILGWLPVTATRRLRALAPNGIVLGSALLALPYAIVSAAYGMFAVRWFLLYLLLPPLAIVLLAQAKEADPDQLGNWRDFAVLLVLGLAVDLRWFEHAWPARLAVFNKVLLLDVGLLGFSAVRQLSGIGFDLLPGRRDLLTGVREFLFYAPAAVALGLALGFLHLHRRLPGALILLGTPLFTFFFIAIPEELFFRGWLQNLLERRLGRPGSLATTALLFGLAHFNKRAAHFNWRYVLLAAIAGLFYGRAWRRDRRVAASAITHTLVDSVWSILLR